MSDTGFQYECAAVDETNRWDFRPAEGGSGGNEKCRKPAPGEDINGAAVGFPPRSRFAGMTESEAVGYT